VQVVRGSGAYLFDEQGRAYLDLVDNVAHVGHAHPYVNARAAEQASRLNTNTRYLHHAIVEYARNLAATLPDPLSVVFFVNSGSEGERPRHATGSRPHPGQRLGLPAARVSRAYRGGGRHQSYSS
jgi:glutamate-1-semialdehyde aminotransferase